MDSSATRVFIKNYTIVAAHGYYKREHSQPQRFVVSVACVLLRTDLSSDDTLESTLNYELLRSIITEVLNGPQRKLVETLAHDIAQKVLDHKDVRQVDVEIKKPDVWKDCEPGISITVTK